MRKYEDNQIENIIEFVLSKETTIQLLKNSVVRNFGRQIHSKLVGKKYIKKRKKILSILSKYGFDVYECYDDEYTYDYFVFSDNLDMIYNSTYPYDAMCGDGCFDHKRYFVVNEIVNDSERGGNVFYNNDVSIEEILTNEYYEKKIVPLIKKMVNQLNKLNKAYDELDKFEVEHVENILDY